MKKEEKLKKWEELIKQYEKSGLTLTDWCEQSNTTKGTYHYWKKQLELKEDKSNAKKTEEIHFVKIEQKAMGELKPAKLRITWKEVKIEISTKEEIQLVAELIKKLQEIC